MLSTCLFAIFIVSHLPNLLYGSHTLRFKKSWVLLTIFSGIFLEHCNQKFNSAKTRDMTRLSGPNTPRDVILNSPKLSYSFPVNWLGEFAFVLDN